MRYFFLGFFFLVILVVGMLGFRGSSFSSPPLEFLPDMDHQAKVKYQDKSDFFSDGSGSRKPVAGTQPMGFSLPEKSAHEGGVPQDGFSVADDYYNSGRFGDYWGHGMPEGLEIDEGFLRRGQERFQIYCAICHGAAGDGQGVTSKYGIANIANFHAPMFASPDDPNFRTDGDMFNTISKGKGTMGPYGAMINVKDRWAIVAYVRALQDATMNPPVASSDEDAESEPEATN